MREFTKIAPTLWGSRKFRGLPSDRDRLYYVYVLTSGHQNSAGVYRLPDAYAAEDLDWPLEEVRQARDTCSNAGLVLYDEATREIWIEQWFTHNPPMNDRHVKGTRKQVEAIDSDRLREIAQEQFDAAVSGRPSDKEKAKAARDAIAASNSALSLNRLTRADPSRKGVLVSVA